MLTTFYLACYSVLISAHPLRRWVARPYWATSTASAFMPLHQKIKVFLRAVLRRLTVHRKRVTYVYVDGFNLYYGALKNSAPGHKWLNLLTMSRLMMPGHDIERIKYFTAHVSARPSDPDQPVRQQAYLRALQSLPNIEVILGRFITKQIRAALVHPIGKMRTTMVWRTDEKGSDVNLAVHLLHDAYHRKYDAAVVISNDSDLAEAIRIVRNDFHIPVWVLNPGHPYTSTDLRKVSSSQKRVRSGVIRASQFPPSMTDAGGTFQKPASW